MNSLWNDKEASRIKKDPLQLRVYTSRLIGQEPDLVLHGGGNTSVKGETLDLFGQKEDVLFVKGSGWDLASIEKEGFAPVRLDALKRMAELESLSDTEMVRAQRTAMTDPYAPNPSVEAILHAIIPFKYVDHTHADAVVTLTNTPGGVEKIREVYGDSVLIIPYVMPGFILARRIYEMTRDLAWSDYKGMILMNHGIFTFDDEARACYENMITLVRQAQKYIHTKLKSPDYPDIHLKENLLELARIRKAVSTVRALPVLARLDQTKSSLHFSDLPNVSSIATRGPLTPDHVIRTKRIPVIIKQDGGDDVNDFVHAYKEYFDRNTDGNLTCLDQAPRWGIWPGHGTLSFGSSLKEAQIINDIKDHTQLAIQNAEGLGGWEALSEKDVFQMEYWELEQAKLKKASAPKPFQGKVVLVTGAASGIGRACAETFAAEGACVVALDIDPQINNLFLKPEIMGVKVDLTQSQKLQAAVDLAIRSFGGLDVVVSNAGIFPPGLYIENLEESSWNDSLAVNLSSHQSLLKCTIPFLKLGIEPSIIIIGSKNVPAPGPGVSAYSVAKAGLSQLGRVAALELSGYGIRVNIVHPNAVFDTGIWSEEKIKQRAKSYGKSVEEYKTSNLLRQIITSGDVAQMVCTMAGGSFSKTTGAQVPVDGGNERVI